MSNRPSIPVKIKRQILIESGHRCAVDGTPCPLELAHIIPWRKSQKHDADNLICLCANCHTRADKENWDESTFREYKCNPWVNRQFKGAAVMPKDTAEVTIIIDGELDDFDEQKRALLPLAVASLLNLPPTHVRLKSVTESSIKATLELPVEAAKELTEAYERKDLDLMMILASVARSEEPASSKSVASTALPIPLWVLTLLIFLLFLLAMIAGALIFNLWFSNPAGIPRLVPNVVPTPLTPVAPVANQVAVGAFGQNAWLMTSTSLAMLAMFPGLTLSFAGLVRRKNVLSVIGQCWGIIGVVTIIWILVGYSLVFGRGGPILGSPFTLLNDATPGAGTDYASGVSQNMFAIYHLMFAIMASLLIVGAVAERMKFAAVLAFAAIWVVAVFCPVAHMMWAGDGFMNGIGNQNAAIKAIDFAGGSVVHMTAGWSALILCLILGKRLGFGRESMQPHSMVLTMLGTGMLWVGWHGFTSGRALGANDIATTAFCNTLLAASVGGFVWAMSEYLVRGRPSILGFCSGTVAGLVVITPACGFVNLTGSVIIGIAAGIIPYFACWKLKQMLGYDDALDTFGIHGVGGTLGMLLAGILATTTVNSSLAGVIPDLLSNQLKAIAVTFCLSVVSTTVIAFIVKTFVGLRPSEEAESAGLDLAEHGEEGYHGD